MVLQVVESMCLPDRRFFWAYGIIRENGVNEWLGINNHDYKAVIRELKAAF